MSALTSRRRTGWAVAQQPIATLGSEELMDLLRNAEQAQAQLEVFATRVANELVRRSVADSGSA